MGFSKRSAPNCFDWRRGIVNAAHLTAYQIAKFHVLGIHDINSDNLKKTAKKWDLESYKDITDLIDIAAASDAVFDLATPKICPLQGAERLFSAPSKHVEF